jgi:hypothetical protein
MHNMLDFILIFLSFKMVAIMRFMSSLLTFPAYQLHFWSICLAFLTVSSFFFEILLTILH